MRNGAGFALIYAARILFEFAARAVRASLGLVGGFVRGREGGAVCGGGNAGRGAVLLRVFASRLLRK